MDRADLAWLVSPHLLVAQAMAVALVSAGTPAEARPWQSAILDQLPTGGVRERPRRLVVVLDGFEGASRIAEVVHLVQTTEVRILLVTSSGMAARWGELLQDDRVDLATEVTSVARLAAVVEDFLADRALLDSRTREELCAAWLRDLERRHRVATLLATLSPRQLRVLELLATGRRVAEVAAALGVTSGTVRSHVKTLRAKLGARSQLEAVAMLRLAHDLAGVDGSTRTASSVAPADGALALLPRPRDPSDGSGAETRR